MGLTIHHKYAIIRNMRITFKYRLYPTSAQRTALQKSLDACRWVYNKTLETRKEAWEQHRQSVSRYDTIKMLPEWKNENSFLNNAFSQCLQEVCTRIDLAFYAFFRRVKAGEKPGYPRFRGYDRYDSFTYPQLGFKFTDNGRLYLSKIGNVKIKLHRPVEGTIKTLTIRRNRLGNWYACFSCVVEPQPKPPVPSVVGIDLGLKKFATFSTGETVDNPRFFRQDEQALAKAQRKMSKYEKGSPERTVARRAVNHIYQRITNHRADFAHKLSRRLADEYQIIAFEDLSIDKMVKNHCLAKSISDAAWNQLVQYTTYKAEYAGRRVILVNPRNTSQMCSGCGNLVEKDLSIRTHSCPHCGLTIDRDLNAARNILARGLSCIQVDSSTTGRSCGTLVPAE